MHAINLQAKTLHKASTPLEYQIYRAGLEWDLLDPIVIEKRDDLKSESRWRNRVEPYHHQVTNLITFCRRLPVTLLADDVGLGKTISAGLIVSELIARSRLSKFLVVCPKLLGPQWKEELASKFDIPSTIATGRDLIHEEPEEHGAIITTYNSARLYLDDIPRDRFEMLILDEAHKLRNLYGVEPPPQVARRFRAALEDRRFRYVLMLTATPIQNRLWDLYSLVDLLTVARGHQNPFGGEGIFTRKFIADGREKARQLRPEAREEFRSIVYGYMSRIRRGDAKLYFPDRKVQMHKVKPTPGELELIQTIAKPIQKMNRLAQISILQALTSSPEALKAQLENMARNGTASRELSQAVSALVMRMPLTAKLQGLGALIERLQKENPERWRLVVFTGRRETQTTIQTFLEQKGLKVGIINGSSGLRNQQTLAGFRKTPPACHVIVSTEAGSEGINLQVANVLVNYDLPWNPMIVEQRIGRVQRLASDHASVAIFNIILSGTFEEYIVGRLMEKLQLASHAIGDIEALLEASGIGEGEDEGASGFDEKIRQLVIDALAGKDFEEATRKAEQSIEDAKQTLAREEENINSLLGGMDGATYAGPRAPRLPAVQRSMEAREFTIGAFGLLGGKVTELENGLVLVEEDGGRQYIRFDEQAEQEHRSVLYKPGTGVFLDLVHRVVASGMHSIEDLDEQPARQCREIASTWIRSFNASVAGIDVQTVSQCFDGKAVVRVRVTVAHDSYERLVSVKCSGPEHMTPFVHRRLDPIPELIQYPRDLGLNLESVVRDAQNDAGISEFCRFYLERREEEVKSAGDDRRKIKKLEDEFTPRLEMSLVGLEGKVYRRAEVQVRFKLEGEKEYASTLTLVPHDPTVVDAPKLLTCTKSGRSAPSVCFKQCEVSGKTVLEELLGRSETSGRYALPEFMVTCTSTGQRLLQDEVERSAVTGQLVAKRLLKTSAMSGKKAEPVHFSRCEFTGADLLLSETAISDASGKRYRSDEVERSSCSGKSGHRSEFVSCAVSGQRLLPSEIERCEVTGTPVGPGILQTCSLSGKRVLPAELEVSAISGRPVRRCLLRQSSISGKLAEPEHFGRCEFTGAEVLKSELAKSEISEKYYRGDESAQSVVSGKSGHVSEFIQCHETRQRLAPTEAEQCQVTGHHVRPGILQACEVSEKRVLPNQLERCASSGKKALKSFMVTSSVSDARVLEALAVRSAAGNYCLPTEAQICSWSGEQIHPDDIRTCELTGLTIHSRFAGNTVHPRLQVLTALLDGTRRSADAQQSWDSICQHLKSIVGWGRCTIEAAVLSPDKRHLAVCCADWQILRTRYVGALYTVDEQVVEGRIAIGKRTTQGWSPVH
jgi:superfamily II DNA or RNA helicase